MKPLQKLNNFVEKHWYYHKEVGDGKAIFYYRSIWNVIVRRKCNQYVVNVGDAKLVEFFFGWGGLIYTFLVKDIARYYYNYEFNEPQSYIAIFILTIIAYHISIYLVIVRNYTNLTN